MERSYRLARRKHEAAQAEVKRTKELYVVALERHAAAQRDVDTTQRSLGLLRRMHRDAQWEVSKFDSLYQNARLQLQVAERALRRIKRFYGSATRRRLADIRRKMTRSRRARRDAKQEVEEMKKSDLTARRKRRAVALQVDRVEKLSFAANRVILASAEEVERCKCRYHGACTRRRQELLEMKKTIAAYRRTCQIRLAEIKGQVWSTALCSSTFFCFCFFFCFEEGICNWLKRWEVLICWIIQRAPNWSQSMKLVVLWYFR